MSFWTKVRRPLIGFATGGPVGATIGAAIDAKKGQGFFEPTVVPAGDWRNGGRPTAPGYNPSYNPEAQGTAKNIQDQLSANAALQGIAKEGTRKGRSNWANLSLQEQERQASHFRDRAAQQAGSAAAGARSQLQMRGGLSTGAAERIAQNSANDVLALNQDVSEKQLGNAAQIGINDESNRLGALQTAGASAMAQQGMMNNANQFDIGQSIREKEAQNAFAMNQYNQQMQAWAAMQNANAVRESGGKK